jgi:hypothetical protein
MRVALPLIHLVRGSGYLLEFRQCSVAEFARIPSETPRGLNSGEFSYEGQPHSPYSPPNFPCKWSIRNSCERGWPVTRSINCGAVYREP